MSPSEISVLLGSEKPPRLLDVRQPDEHAMVALPGARLIPLPELPMRLGELADWKGEEIVVYCHHGVRSALAIGLLGAAGFKRLHNLSGGIDRWSREVDPRLPRY